MIKLLTVDDAQKYLEHLNRVKTLKGMRSIKNAEEVEKILRAHLELNNLVNLLSKQETFIWGSFDEEDKIVSSIFATQFKETPMVFFENYKSESLEFFNPLKNILKMADVIFKFFEEREIYSYILIRPLELFNSRRFSNIEDLYPLNRYNSYFSDIIPAHEYSKWPLYNRLLRNRSYDIDLAVVIMELKQQNRKYGNRVFLPLKSGGTN